jgi:hypothetical protein
MNDPSELSPSSSTPSPSSSTPASAPAPEKNWASDRKAEQEAAHPPAPPRREQPANPRAQPQPAWSDGRDATSRHRIASEARAREARGEPPLPSTATGEQQPPGSQPASVAGEKFKIGDVVLSAEEWAATAADKAARDSAKLTLPATPGDYRAELPADLVLPQGVEWKFNEADPTLALARQFAHKSGLSQTQFAELVGIYASGKIAEASKIRDAIQGERAKLGATGTARLGAIERFYIATYGEADGRIKTARILTADDVRIAEREIALASQQRPGGFSPSREAPPGSNGSIPGYDKMTFEQRRAAQEDAKRR